MKKLARNRAIIADIRSRLKESGLDDVMDVFPVENTFTRRPRYWVDSDGVALFKVHMWNLNSLDKQSLRHGATSTSNSTTWWGAPQYPTVAYSA